MLRFRITNVVPPGGRYFFEVGGKSFMAPTRGGLLKQVLAAYQASGTAAPDDIEAVIEDYMCRRLPEGFCLGSDDGRPRAKVVTISGLKAAVERAVQQSQGVAPPALVRFRTMRCVDCSCNDRGMCSTCTGVNAWAARRVGRPDQLPAFRWLGVCRCDLLPLAAKVNLAGLPVPEDVPENCWMLTEEQTDGR